MNKLQKVAMTVATVLASAGAVLAEGEPAFDISEITAAQTALSTGMKSMMSGAVPVVLGLIFAGLVFWGLFWIYGLLKSAANKAKAR